jgi:AcrR family transcriptional regulator
VWTAKCILSRIPAVETRQLLPRRERRAQLLGAAASAFAHAGFAATSMDDVAAAAGVTRLILYRHFASKEDLYRAVLDRVSTRLREEFVAGFEQAGGRAFTVRAMLNVARENPDGFRLLWVHAAREPQFAGYAHAQREQAADAADFLIGRAIDDRVIRGWATHAFVGVIVESVLAWLDHGTADRDEEFVDRATAGLRALYGVWVGSR